MEALFGGRPDFCGGREDLEPSEGMFRNLAAPIARGGMELKNLTRTLAVLSLLITPFAALPAAAASVEVKLKLPQRARLDLQGRKSLAVAPFIVVTKEGAD